MFIYVSGPYTPVGARCGHRRRHLLYSNISRADAVARELAQRGHVPFVPHTMLRGWEEQQRMPRTLVMAVATQWLARCDALFFIGASPGADVERAMATRLGLPVYNRLDDVPPATADPPGQPRQGLSPEAFQASITEYEQCMESYRHTYETIWQASALFSAISAAIVAFGDRIGSFSDLIAPLPVIFWYVGIFRPMNRYGEARNDRLVEIEESLSRAIPGLDMRHYRRFSTLRKSESGLRRALMFRWLTRPRVKEVVTIFGVGLIALEVYLLVREFL